jgi:F-type H+-transporting ATPase subunit gamma
VSSNLLLAQRPEKRVLLALVSGDKGLAGAFNSNLIKAAVRFPAEHNGAEMTFELVGRKGRDFFRKRNAKISGDQIGLAAKPSYQETAAIARRAMQLFSDGEVDAVYLLYNEFKSVMTQRVTLSRILPVEVQAEQAAVDYIFEQPPGEMLEGLLPRYVEMEFYRALLESSAAEHAARMTAMDAATNNAADVIDRLTLNMNRVRQASITKEIIEVVSGAAAAEEPYRRRSCRRCVTRGKGSYGNSNRNRNRNGESRPSVGTGRGLRISRGADSPGLHRDPGDQRGLRRSRTDRYHLRSAAAHRRRSRAHHCATADRRPRARHESGESRPSGGSAGGSGDPGPRAERDRPAGGQDGSG